MACNRPCLSEFSRWIVGIVIVSTFLFLFTTPFHASSPEAARRELESKGYVVKGEVVRRFPFWPCLKDVRVATFKANVVVQSGKVHRVTVCYGFFRTRIFD